MKWGIYRYVLLGLTLAAGTQMHPQAPAQPPAPSPQSPAPAKPPADTNPFPGDTTNVPVMPNATTAGAPDPATAPADVHAPTSDDDPVRSPDDPVPDDSGSSGESSSTTNLEKVLPPPDTDTRGKGKDQPPPQHQESAQEDVNVGLYYLDKKNWRAALSRFESAVVLDPENPDVYWGLAEAQRHLNNFTAAKANYLQLLEYDPDGKHGKEARKLLKDPDLANASAAPPPPSQH